MMRFLMKTAHQLLFLSALPIDASKSSALNPLLCQIENWNELVEEAARHRLLPRLYSFLKRNEAQSFLEEDTWKKIRGIYLAEQFHVLALEAELTENLLPHFNRVKIDILLLKGAALNQTVYHTRPIRSFADLDLMIRPEDLKGTEALLSELGYQHSKPTHFPSEWHRQQLEPFLHPNAFEWTHTQKKVSVDLHTEAFDDENPFSLPPHWLWKEARLISISEKSALVPHPNQLFLHLLLHLAKHIGMRQNFLGWYTDLDESLRYFRQEIDGHSCWEILRTGRQANELLEILAFLGLHFDSPLPEIFQAQIREGGVSPFPLQRIFIPGKQLDLLTFNHNYWVDRREHFLSSWNRVRGFWKKLYFLVRWILPSREYLQTKYPSRNFLGRLASYGKHFAALFYKGTSLIFYAAGRRFSCAVRKNGYTVAAWKNTSDV